MERRKFLLTAGGALAAAGAAAIDAPHVIARPKYQWRMVTTWTHTLDVLQGNANRFARIVEEMSEEGVEDANVEMESTNFTRQVN